jgi:ubiquinone/menaquinone biosynthesis C-methylase UbiE
MTIKKVLYSEKQYDSFASEFKLAQQQFYSKKNESREIIYSLLDFSLKNKNLLDIGCGFGKDLVYYKQNGAKVFGIDVSKKMIQLAKENTGLENLSVQDYAKTNFESAFFDVVVSRYALQYKKDLKKTFSEIHRILRKGGVFILLVSQPLLGYVAKKEKNYYHQEIVDMPLFKGQVITKEPTHTLSDYVSDFMLNNFTLISQKESKKTENKFPSQNIPDFIFFIYPLFMTTLIQGCHVLLISRTIIY